MNHDDEQLLHEQLLDVHDVELHDDDEVLLLDVLLDDVEEHEQLDDDDDVELHELLDDDDEVDEQDELEDDDDVEQLHDVLLDDVEQLDELEDEHDEQVVVATACVIVPPNADAMAVCISPTMVLMSAVTSVSPVHENDPMVVIAVLSALVPALWNAG